MQIGIVGLPNSTKTTVFNALTRSQVETSTFSSGQLETHAAVISVPDDRVDRLSKMFEPRKTTYACIQYNDIAGLRVGIGREGGLTGPLLNLLAQSDALLHVVRAFDDPRVAHPNGSVDPARDLAALDFEFIFSDLVIVERRIERLEHDLARKRGEYVERQAAEDERALLERVRAALETEKPVRDLDLTAQEAKRLRGYQFLSEKPVLVMLNVGDDGDIDPDHHISYQHSRSAVICLRGGLEMEIARLEPEEAELFRNEYGIEEPGLNRLIRASYHLLDLQSFFTVGDDEVRAWTIRRGASAVEAAGVIHSDLARGFIRAEVVSTEHLLEAGSLAEARRRGQLRLEGRDYAVRDGDILTIRFNV
ncbi:MAG: redox-regulated ATPase YchF [Chloroflexi bacterium]|nr:redox-regulated ATPase YchF [Chloroflexota bacterium]